MRVNALAKDVKAASQEKTYQDFLSLQNLLNESVVMDLCIENFNI